MRHSNSDNILAGLLLTFERIELIGVVEMKNNTERFTDTRSFLTALSVYATTYGG